MRELSEGAADTVVGAVVGGFLDAVSAEDGGFAVVVVGFVGCEVNFPKEPGNILARERVIIWEFQNSLLLMVFEFAHHLVSK